MSEAPSSTTRRLTDAKSFGAACRASRLSFKMTLVDAALAAGVNVRFASELENGKPSAQLELALRYAATLGIELFYQPSLDDPEPNRRRLSRRHLKR